MTAPLQAVLDCLNRVILGKEPQVRLAFTCLLARGHLLIEDLPGLGKTTLSHALAASLGLQWRRQQFTSDMLPAELIGVSIFDPEQQQFRFHPGPLFSQVLLADEINRASPKTQSALLEAMAEGQVSVEGRAYPLPRPFFVIATQNPTEQLGTFPLPESQLDRFLMRIELGFPAPAAERALLRGDRQLHIPEPLLSPDQLAALQQQVDAIHASEPLLDYLLALLQASRGCSDLHPLSPRAGLQLLAAARAWALLAGRDHVLPEDVQAVFAAVADHRLVGVSGNASRQPSQRLLTQVDPVQP